MVKQYRKLSIPYIIWLSVLVFIPMTALILLGFSNLTSSIQLSNIQFSFSNISIFGEESTKIAFQSSLKYAALTTLISFVLGYLLAYVIYKSKFKNKFMIMTLMILPMWSNIILRIDGLASIMKENNILIDLIGFSPVGNLINTPVGLLIGMVFTYIPFMILPIYTALEKIDPNLDEASSDLGLTPFKTFAFVTFPLSFKGVVTGTIMVFLPTFSGFAIPKLLTPGLPKLLGNIIEEKFIFTNYNVGAILSSSVLLLIFVAMFLLRKFDKEGETLL